MALFISHNYHKHNILKPLFNLSKISEKQISIVYLLIIALYRNYKFNYDKKLKVKYLNCNQLDVF